MEVSSSFVFGGGGLFGIAFNMAVAAHPMFTGYDWTSTPMLGTSAGSWSASALACELSFADLECVVSPDFVLRPQFSGSKLTAMAREVFGERRHAAVSAMAATLPGLSLRMLRGDRCDLADLVVASSAVPGLVPPHKIGRTWYVDGGVRSLVSADRAAAATTLVQVVPVTSTTVGTFATFSDRQLRTQTDRWLARNPDSTVVTFLPPPEVSALVSRPWHLFDAVRAHDCFDMVTESPLTPTIRTAVKIRPAA